MKISRFRNILLLISVTGILFPAYSATHHNVISGSENFFEPLFADTKQMIVKTPTDGGIREEIPGKYKEKYEKWKAEILSTEFSRRQWDEYADNKKFILTITIAGDRGQGAGTDKFLWDEDGNFVGATITLGNKIDKGYPDPVYYPVMNSLTSNDSKYSVSGNILASTKIIHEFGHVNQTAKENQTLLQIQNKLTPVYISIFLKNGRNTNAQDLLDLARQMGGTPTKIWESREYWSEINAMFYLKEKIGKENFYCSVFNKIKYNVEQYAKDYENRFDQINDSNIAPCSN
jgi:hypothetical protein